MRKRDPVVNVDGSRRRVEINNVGINRALMLLDRQFFPITAKFVRILKGYHVARFSKPGKHMIHTAQAISIISYLLTLVNDERHPRSPVKEQ